MPVRHGSKWRVRWIDESGKRRSAVFDDYRVAQTEERKRKVEVDDVRRGLRAATPPEKTFGELCDYWLEKRAVRKRSGKDDRSIIKKHLRPAFGSRLLRDIGVEDGDDYVNEREHLSEKTLANHITLLTTMLNAATSFKTPWLLKVPKFNKPKVSLFSRDFRYLRTEEEIRRFLTAARDEGEQVFVLYAAAIYTGLRAGELAALEWQDVDFERRLITVQRSFGGPTKSDRVRYAPILTPLLAILREWRLRHPGRLVFTNRDGRRLAPSARIYQEVLHRVLDAAGFPAVEEGGKVRRYIVFHSLRHTFAAHWVARGGDIFKLQKILGHQSIAMTMRYAHLAPEAYAADFDRLGTEAPVAVGAVVELRPVPVGVITASGPARASASPPSALSSPRLALATGTSPRRDERSP
jgi:integrase